MLRSSVVPPLTVKLLAEVPVPPEVVTVTFPVVEPLATVAVICVALLTVKAEADVPLNFTDDAPVKFVPVITTGVPTGPLPGFIAEIAGTGGVTVKALAEVPVPLGVVTLTVPVVVPLATVAVICVAVFTVNAEATVELNLTAVAPVKFVPVIVTDAPTGPLVGVKLIIVGAASTVKFVPEDPVPTEVVTEILPVFDPAATVAVIWVALSTENVLAAWPPNLTELAPVKFVPVRMTTAPVFPEVGAKLATVGEFGGGAVLFEAALPQAAIARSRPEASTARPIRWTGLETRFPANLLLINDKKFGHAELPGRVSMPHCWRFGGEPQGCVSAKTSASGDRGASVSPAGHLTQGQ
jgi:hypothetical protein